MEIYIRDYRRIKSADLEIPEGGILLVAGQNQQGKTSLAQAVQAALTGDALAAPGDADARRTKKAAKALLHYDPTRKKQVNKASVVLRDGEDSSIIRWPKCEYESTGHPSSSEIAAGLHQISLATTAPAERMKLFQALVGSSPEQKDLEEYLAKEELDAEIAAIVWKKICDDGWDETLQKAKVVGQTKKGEYRELTGEAWGIEKSDSWAPDGFREEWRGVSPKAVQAELETAKKDLEDLIASTAQGTQSAENWHRLTARITELENEIAKATESLKNIEADLAEAEQAAEKLTYTAPLLEPTCPHCEGDLVISIKPGSHQQQRPDLMIQKGPRPEMSDDEEHEAGVQEAKISGAISRLRPEKVNATTRLQGLQERLKAAKEERGDGEPVTDEETEKKVQAARERVEAAAQKLEMISAVAKAHIKHVAIATNAKVQQALSDQGVRGIVLLRGLAKFKQRLQKAGEMAGMGAVLLEDDQTFSVNGRPYRDLSGSEQLRLVVLLQAVTASFDGSDLVVVDIDDATDYAHILSIIRMLTALRCQALVCCHFDSKDQAPVLQSDRFRSAHITGVTYWIDNGVAAPLG